jgi:hypothetical protein
MNAAEKGNASPKVQWGRAWAHWALGRWAAFPIDCEPRPLVLVGPPVRAEGGFRSGAAKLAFVHGDLQSAVPRPAEAGTGMVRAAATRRRRPGGARIRN